MIQEKEKWIEMKLSIWVGSICFYLNDLELLRNDTGCDLDCLYYTLLKQGAVLKIEVAGTISETCWNKKALELIIAHTGFENLNLISGAGLISRWIGYGSCPAETYG